MLLFCILTLMIALVFWAYLNWSVRVRVPSSDMYIELPEQLDTTLKVKNQLKSHVTGALDTQIDIDRKISLPLKGEYPAQLQFVTTVPVKVALDYNAWIHIDDQITIYTTTDMIYQNRFLPKLPVQLDIPLKLKVPFKLHQDFVLPIEIHFDDQVRFDFNEQVNAHIKHRFSPTLKLNDDMTLTSIAETQARLIQPKQNKRSEVSSEFIFPLKDIILQRQK